MPLMAIIISDTTTRFYVLCYSFYSMYGFPGVIGCLDCTHCAIVPPNTTNFDERSYVNRKGYHSINTQLVNGFLQYKHYH